MTLYPTISKHRFITVYYNTLHTLLNYNKTETNLSFFIKTWIEDIGKFLCFIST